MPLRLVVIYGSVRSARRGIRAARFVVDECRKRGHEVTLIDPLEYRLPLLDKMYKEYPKGQAPEMLERLAALIVPADGVVVGTRIRFRSSQILFKTTGWIIERNDGTRWIPTRRLSVADGKPALGSLAYELDIKLPVPRGTAWPMS